MQETFERFGADTVHAAAAALLDYSEARTRAAIAGMPDGRYENELFLDHDGVGEAAVRLKVTVGIAGDGIEFDFAGTRRSPERAIAFSTRPQRASTRRSRWLRTPAFRRTPGTFAPSK